MTLNSQREEDGVVKLGVKKMPMVWARDKEKREGQEEQEEEERCWRCVCRYLCVLSGD